MNEFILIKNEHDHDLDLQKCQKSRFYDKPEKVNRGLDFFFFKLIALSYTLMYFKAVVFFLTVWIVAILLL
jgi:hypothetical protein